MVFTNRRTATIAVILLLAHVILVVSAAGFASPTLDEPAHIVAGLTHFEFQRYDVYNVNPPLARYFCAFPVWLRGYVADWGSFRSEAGVRPEFEMGRDFAKANQRDLSGIIALCRYGCLPFTLVGGLACFFWSRELWQCNSAGLASLFLWCFDPNILAYASVATPDCACTAFGILSGYAFWRWVEMPGLQRAIVAGMSLGLAAVTKFTWISLFAIWPVIAVVHFAVADGYRNSDAQGRLMCLRGVHVSLMCAVGLLVVNLAYCCDGTLEELGGLCFVSRRLSGEQPLRGCNNRFRGSFLAPVPVLLPRQYVQGIDVQMRDFEDFGRPSYLRGEWKKPGWWYYYVYGFAVKAPHGLQLLLAVACGAVWRAARRAAQPRRLMMSMLTVLLPAGVVVGIASYGVEINHHCRYALPAMGFMFVFCGAAVIRLEGEADSTRAAGLVRCGCV